MEIDKLARDLKILLDLKRKGAIRDVDWNLDGLDNWIIIFGAAKLPPGEFNLPDMNIKLPVPANLYEPSSRDRYHFYSTIFIDSKLRRKSRRSWEPIARQFPDMYPEEKGKGWSFLCVFPADCHESTDVRSILPVAANWIITNGKGKR